MKRKIAIIKSVDHYHGDYGDEGYTTIVQSITDWAEVTEDEFKSLQQASYRLGFKLLEQPTDVPAFIKQTVADYLAFTKAEEARLEKEKAARAQAALERKFKKELKDKASKLKMFQKLKEELGDEIS